MTREAKKVPKKCAPLETIVNQCGANPEGSLCSLGVGGSRSLGLGKRGGVGRCPNRFLGLSLNDRTNLDIPCDLSG